MNKYYLKLNSYTLSLSWAWFLRILRGRYLPYIEVTPHILGFSDNASTVNITAEHVLIFWIRRIFWSQNTFSKSCLEEIALFLQVTFIDKFHYTLLGHMLLDKKVILHHGKSYHTSNLEMYQLPCPGSWIIWFSTWQRTKFDWPLFNPGAYHLWCPARMSSGSSPIVCSL